MRKKVSILAAFALLFALPCVPAAFADDDDGAGTPAKRASAKPYNPVETLRAPVDAEEAGNPESVLPSKERKHTVSFAVAPAYFFEFGNDLPDGDGWGLSIIGGARFSSDTPRWEFLADVELFAFSAESGEFSRGGVRVKEDYSGANMLFHLGLARSFGDVFVLEALLGLGYGLSYSEIKGEHYKTSSSGDFTTVLSARLRGEFRITDNWGVFAAYRFAYLSPSTAARIADWEPHDLFPQSVEIGLRYRF